MADPATLFDKIWSSHAILVRPDGVTLLQIDRHIVHDDSGNAFRMLKEKGLPVRRPDRTFATPDHYVSTTSHGLISMNESYRRGSSRFACKRPAHGRLLRKPQGGLGTNVARSQNAR
jgi:3-isopropylmalate/(R)-2-methylmalate dehydratase large subunit